MVNKILGIAAVLCLAGIVYTFSGMLYLVSSNDITEEEYAHMAQELVDHSIEPVCTADTCQAGQ